LKIATSLSIGDRELPLEADIAADAIRDHELIGKSVEVSPIAGGDLKDKRGNRGKITGVYERFGKVVGYEVKIKGSSFHGSNKDFFVHREYLEDLQPPTATSASLRDGLSHWAEQRDYWHNRTEGLEAFCFSLASVTPRALPQCFHGGWRFLVPSPMPGDRVVVDCRAPLHGNFWTLGTMVYPERLPIETPPALIEDHWSRVFTWAHYVATSMIPHGYPWEKAARGLEVRARATANVLRPMVEEILQQCVQAKTEITGEAAYIAPGSVSAAFSSVRLKAATVGLVEPATDRRPYQVMSISPTAAKDPDYLKQVVLHECIHIVVGSNGGDPHNDEFLAISEKMGLRPEHRD
jgi:hypothetical protein